MSTQATIKTYSVIIEKVNSGRYPTKKELTEAIDEYVMAKSDRTISRYLDALRDDFGIAIEYDTYKKGYFINQEETNDLDKFINFLEILMSVNVIADNLKDWKNIINYVSFESRGNLKGLENLSFLLDAVKNNKVISFNHQSFEADKAKNYILNPYLLKEYQGRWYVIGAIKGKKGTTTFGIDRISELKVMDETFKRDSKIDPIKNFEHVIGLHYSDSDAEAVILSFTPHQGKYIRTLPLHTSQEILKDDAEEFRIRLFVVANFELRQKILMFGASVEVIEPIWFREEVMEELGNSMKRYL